MYQRFKALRANLFAERGTLVELARPPPSMGCLLDGSGQCDLPLPYIFNG
jgi:hypothetical protein